MAQAAFHSHSTVYVRVTVCLHLPRVGEYDGAGHIHHSQISWFVERFPDTFLSFLLVLKVCEEYLS